MDGKEYNKIASSILLGVLIVLAFLLIKPLLLAIFLGMVLAFVLSPLYKKLLLLIKYKNLLQADIYIDHFLL